MDYVNYVRDYDEDFGHPQNGSAKIVSSWREVYQLSMATPPESWKEGRFLPDGHTVCCPLHVSPCVESRLLVWPSLSLRLTFYLLSLHIGIGLGSVLYRS